MCTFLTLAVSLLCSWYVTVCEGSWNPENINVAIAENVTARWIISVREKVPGGQYVHRCTGVLVDHSLILTAASCVENRDSGSQYQVTIGCTDIRMGDLDPELTYPVTDIHVHDQYDAIAHQYDAALLTVSQSFTTDFLPHMKDNTEDYLTSDPFNLRDNTDLLCHVYYWPPNELMQENEYKLHRMEVRIIPRRLCKRMMSIIDIVTTDNQVCSCNFPYQMPTDCTKSQGGPLVCKGHLTGILSHSDVTCTHCFPELYTRVDRLRNWLRSFGVEHA